MFLFILPKDLSKFFGEDDFNGRNNDPNAAHIKTITDSTNIVLRQPTFCMHNATSGAKTKVPNPDPATAKPSNQMKQSHKLHILI